MVAAIKMVVLFFIYGCDSFEITQPFSKDKVVHFYKFFDACPDKQNTSSTFGNFRLTAEGSLFDYDYVARRRITKAHISVEIERCASREAPDTCVKLATLRSDKACKMLESDREFWSGAFACTTPRMRCPISVGAIDGRNCSLDMGLFRWFPMSPSAYFKTRFLIESKRPHFIIVCAEAHWQLKRRH